MAQAENLKYIGFDVKVLHLELTSRCNALCPMCARTTGLDYDNELLKKRDDLNLIDTDPQLIKNVLEQLQPFVPEHVFINGNFGDPIMYPYLLDVVRMCKDAGVPQVTLSTNGSAQTEAWWRELAQIMRKPDKVIFAIDGLEDTNHLYRQGVNWDIAWENALAFIEAGGKAEWDYLIFAHNEHQVEEARALAEKVGFRKFLPKKTGRFFSTMKVAGKEEHQAVNRKGEKQQLLQKPKEVKYQNKALDKIQELKEKHGTLENYFDNVEISCKVAAEKNMYLSAEGLVLPCCWVAGNMYKWWQKPGENQVWELLQQSGGKDAFDAKKHGLRAVLENDYFSKNLVESWSKPNTHMGKPMVCSQKCGKEFDAFKAQFQ